MKWFNKGYWVSKSYKVISLVYWSIYSVYFRTLTYFSVANPGIYLGGMLNERKSDIYNLVPDKYLPKTSLLKDHSEQSITRVSAYHTFPVIVKPNIGYRGFLVRKIDSLSELISAVKEYENREIIIQEYIDLEREYSAMFYKINDENYGISSFIEKHMPKIVGDGKKTILELLDDLENPFIKRKWVHQKLKGQMSRVPFKGECIQIDYVGNYSRGSSFENLNHLIDQDLIGAMNDFFVQVGGMNFCRIDMKSKSLNELKRGHFKILEINGAKSEPLHIYDKDESILSIIQSVSKHWIILFKVVRANIRNSTYPSSFEGIKSYFTLKKLVD